jgi:hypothetical protein
MAVVSPLFADGGEGTGNINFFLGEKFLDGATWAPGDQQLEVGVETSWGKRSWTVLMAADFFYSSNQSTVDAPPTETLSGEESFSTMELGLGFRKIWRAGSARPYWGAGAVVIDAQQEKTKEEASAGVPVEVQSEGWNARGIGGWIGTGVFWRMTQRLNLGLTVRYSLAATTLLEYSLVGNDYRQESFNAGGFHSGLILGWGWQTEGAPIPEKGPVTPGTSAGLAHIVVGRKQLNEGDWGPAETQPEVGIELALGKRSWPVLVSFDYLSSDEVVTVEKVGSFPPSEKVEDVEASTAEYAFGARWMRESRHVRGYFGAGLMALHAERDFDTPLPCELPCEAESGWGGGIWTGGGLAWKIGPFFDLGLAARLSTGNVDAVGGIDPGGLHLGVVVGGGWPRYPPPPAP